MSKEAMKLALEALEDAVLDYSMGKGAVIRHTDAIKALEEALAKQEQRSVSEHLEPVAFIDEQGILRYYKPSDFNQCEYGGLVRLYKEKT